MQVARPEPMLPPILVDEQEARRLLGGLCSKTLFNLRQQGLPHVRLGSRVMYSPADLARWVNERKVAAGVQPTANNRESDNGKTHCE